MPHYHSPEALDLGHCLNYAEITFGLFLENGLDVFEGAFRLADGVSAVDVVAVEGFVKDKDGDIADAA